jgi:glycosyltransferase involved in cell wall biosynthesis
MKKIGLFLTADSAGGGMLQYSMSVLSALLTLPRDEYTLVVAYSDPGWARLVPPNVERLPLRLGRAVASIAALWSILRLSHELWLRYAASFFAVVRYVVNQNCDLWIFPRQDIWSSRFPVPSLAAIHDLMHRYESQFPEAAAFGRQYYRDAYLKELCHDSRGILVDSNVGKQQVLNSYGPDAAKVLVLPYVPPSYIFESSGQNNFEATYRLPAKFLFYPAEFWPHKNHIRLVNALARARAQHSDISLVLSGGAGKERSRIQAHVHRLGLRDHVRFVGYVPDTDMPEFYRRARALIFPTFFGPTNIPPLEAFALGCPVAISGIYGMPEQVGDAALLFDPRSEEEMADCILRLWQDDELCRRLSLSGRRRARLWGPAEFAATLRAFIKQLTDSPLPTASACSEPPQPAHTHAFQVKCRMCKGPIASLSGS